MSKRDVCILFFAVLILLFAFRGTSNFGEQVVKNYMDYVHHIKYNRDEIKEFVFCRFHVFSCFSSYGNGEAGRYDGIEKR